MFFHHLVQKRTKYKLELHYLDRVIQSNFPRHTICSCVHALQFLYAQFFAVILMAKDKFYALPVYYCMKECVGTR